DENGTSITGERWIRYPRVKRFYGKLDQYDPSITDQIEIPMKYKSFGLRILIESIPKGTSVKVKDTSVISGPTPKDEPYLIFTKGLELAQGEGKTDSWECIYSLNKLVQDTTSFILRFDWTKGAGETKSVRKIVKVEAKKMKILKLNFEGDVSETKSGNITFTNMDEDMEDWEETFNYNFNGK
ncbi:MAG: hypothetical protein K2M16_01020, partial [Muribaculaceae bacterium]|nr:hypothetical protein [Muribaculaceae bacterium]